MATHEFKAKSVDDAIAEGLTALGVAKDAVEVEIINKGSRGIFGIGSEPAVVRLTLRSEQVPPSEVATIEEQEVTPTVGNDTAPVIDEEQEQSNISEERTPNAVVAETSTAVTDEPFSAPEDTNFSDDDSYDSDEDGYDDEESDADITIAEEELAEMAADMLDEMIHLMGFSADISTTWFDDEDEDDFDDDGDDEQKNELQRKRYLRLDVEGTDLGALIGRRGETLENIQYLLRLMVNQRIHRWKNIIVDVEHYKERRVNQLTQLAERMADQVSQTGKAISLEPMPANERRVVHMVLRNHPDVYTESYGEGPRRKVHIFARD